MLQGQVEVLAWEERKVKMSLLQHEGRRKGWAEMVDT